MFTGIIEETGMVLAVKRKQNSAVISVSCNKILNDTKIGDSIAVNGICLTVTDFGSYYFSADVMPETINRTSLKQINVGSPVNLERAMAANGRFGGHIVSGHIDGTGVISQITEDENAVIMEIQTEKALLEGMIVKGSVAIDGISLTIISVSSSAFAVSLIPHTRKETNLSVKKIGDTVNLETDVIGKYVSRYFETVKDKEKQSDITMDFLAEKGFI